MPTRELNVFFASITESSRALLEGLLREHDGTLVTTIGKACLCVFENTTQALETALKMKQQVPEARAALTRGMITLSPASAIGEAANLAAQLEGLARPGEILASETFVRSLGGANPFHETEVRSFKGIPRPVKVFLWGSPRKKAPEGDGKEFFDFARVEQERALEAHTFQRPEFKPSESDASIPFAVEPAAAKKAKAETNVPSARTLKKEHRSRALKNALWISLVFIVVLPAVFFGFWWAIGTAQKTLLKGDEEVRQGIESSDVLQALHTKRPEGASARQIASGTFQAYATLLIETSPSRAEVFVDERRIEAMTPLKINKVEARTPLHIVIKKLGYRDHQQLLSLLPNEEKRISVQLTKLP